MVIVIAIIIKVSSYVHAFLDIYWCASIKYKHFFLCFILTADMV